MTTLFLVLAVALATAVLFGRPGAWKKLASSALVVYPIVLIANALTLWWVYGKVGNALRTAGWVIDPYLLKAATAALALVLYAAMPMAIAAFVGRRKWEFAALFGALFCGMNILLYFVSRPTSHQAVNPYDGKYLFKYYRDTQKNCVDRFDRSVEFHPDHIGVKLLPPDDAIHQEWGKNPCKQVQTQPQALNDATGAKHDLWLKKIHVVFDSCVRSEKVVICSFSVTNTDGHDISVRWRDDATATDNEGKYYSGHCRESLVHVYEWADDRAHFDDSTPTKLISDRGSEIHAVFGHINQAVDKFQSLRLHVVYPGWLFGRLNGDGDYLDFANLPIGSQVDTAVSHLPAGSLAKPISGTSPPSQTRVVQVLVPGNQVWTDTGIYLKVGDVAEILPSGYITVYSPESTRDVKPDSGWTVTCEEHAFREFFPVSSDPPAPKLPCWSLIARIGSHEKVIRIERYFVLTSWTEGEFYLGINDITVKNNVGSWNVSIKIKGQLSAREGEEKEGKPPEAGETANPEGAARKVPVK
jgi:hypothetical protein